jgi:hypothetical protein
LSGGDISKRNLQITTVREEKDFCDNGSLCTQYQSLFNVGCFGWPGEKEAEIFNAKRLDTMIGFVHGWNKGIFWKKNGQIFRKGISGTVIIRMVFYPAGSIFNDTKMGIQDAWCMPMKIVAQAGWLYQSILGENDTLTTY